MSYGFNNDKSKFPLGAASDLPDPTKTPMKIIGELQNQIIDSASIENGATASKAYASGDYVCFQGALCKASKAISQGDTLSIGDSANDNLTLTDAAAEFSRINSNLSNVLALEPHATVALNNNGNTRFTPTKNGFVIINGYKNASSNYACHVKIYHDINTDITFMKNSETGSFSLLLPIKKNVNVMISCFSIDTSASFYQIFD